MNRKCWLIMYKKVYKWTGKQTMKIIFLVSLYDTFFVPFVRKFTGHESGISPLRRIGFGLFLATFSMVAAALLEKKRRDVAVNHHKVLSIFWITPQYLIFGLSEMFTAIGLLEFFYKQSLKGMQAFFTAITYCSYSFGFYLSTLLVSLVNNSLNCNCNILYMLATRSIRHFDRYNSLQ